MIQVNVGRNKKFKWIRGDVKDENKEMDRESRWSRWSRGK